MSGKLSHKWNLIPFLLLCLLMFYLIMENALQSIIVILFCSTSIILNLKNFSIRFKEFGIKPLLLVSGFYILLVLSILYSSNLKSGFNEIQRGISILVIPLTFFYFLPFVNKKQWRTLKALFISSNFILFIIFMIVIFSYMQGKSISEIFSLNFRGFLMNNLFKSYHPTYVSISLVLCIVFAIEEIRDTKKNYLVIISAFVIVLFSIFLIMLSVRSIILILIIIVLALFLFNFKKNRTRLLIVFTLCILSTSIIILNTDLFKGRIQEVLNSLGGGDSVNSISLREGIFFCSSNILKSNWLFGVGVGDVQDSLNICYESNHVNLLDKENYNAHNYYLNIFLISGIFGLLSLLYGLFKMFKTALNSKSYVYFSFLIILSISMLFENTLSRIDGILFYSIFNSILFSKLSLDGRVF